MYDAVVLDMDGVILEGRRTPPKLYEQAVRSILSERDRTDNEQLRELLVDPEPSDVDRIRRTLNAADLHPPSVWAAREARTSELENRAIADGERRLYPDAASLRTLDVLLGLVSNNRSATVSYVAGRSGIDFEVVRGRDPTLEGFRRLKPDPFYLDESLARIDADAVAYVGDRRTDLEAARRAGIDGVLLARNGNEPDVELASVADRSIRTLDELVPLVDA